MSCWREKAEIGPKPNGWPERNLILKEERNHAAGMKVLLTYGLPGFMVSEAPRRLTLEVLCISPGQRKTPFKSG